MTFKISNLQKNILGLARDIGYKPILTTERGEINCVRPLGGDYPRFHLYIKETQDDLIFNLHLDQRKPVYHGATAHGGDYEGPVVEQEAERIKNKLITNN